MTLFRSQNSIDSRAWRYTFLAVLLHWVLAVLIIFMIGLGWYMTSHEHDSGVRELVDLHKSIGMIVLVLVFLRLAWRLTHPPQGLPQSVARWQQVTAALNQWLLYVCITIMPVTGILGSLYGRRPTAFFGWPIPKPDPLPALAKTMFQIHGATAWTLAALLIIHTLAAMIHVFINRDRVFQRMWF